MQEKETVWGALKNFFGAKRSNFVDPKKGDSLTDSNDYEVMRTMKSLSWSDLLRPNAVLKEIFNPSSTTREEARQEKGLLGVLDQNAELVVKMPEHETFVPRDQAVSRATWGSALKSFFLSPFQSSPFSQTRQTLSSPLPEPSFDGKGATNPAQLKQTDPLTNKLFEAIENEDVASLQALLKAGANKNAVNQYGESALQVAVEKGSLEMVDALLDHGANANNVSLMPQARAPLLIAAEQGNEEIVSRLLEAGANVNFKDEQGKTALHYASSREVGKLLLEANAEITAEDLNGRAPLHEMALRGDYELIEEALFYGADPNKADSNGRTALLEASQKGHTAVAALLQEHVTNQPDLRQTLGAHGMPVPQTEQEEGLTCVIHDSQRGNSNG